MRFGNWQHYSERAHVRWSVSQWWLDVTEGTLPFCPAGSQRTRASSACRLCTEHCKCWPRWQCETQDSYSVYTSQLQWWKAQQPQTVFPHGPRPQTALSEAVESSSDRFREEGTRPRNKPQPCPVPIWRQNVHGNGFYLSLLWPSCGFATVH